MEILPLVQQQQIAVLFFSTVTPLTAFFTSLYFFPTLRKRLRIFRSIKTKYDYRDLWIRFSESTGDALNFKETLPKTAELIANVMSTRQVAIWLQSATPETFYLAYAHDRFHPVLQDDHSILLKTVPPEPYLDNVLRVPRGDSQQELSSFPLGGVKVLRELQINCLGPVRKNGEILGWFGIGETNSGEKLAAEDEELMLSIGEQIGQLIVNHRLSDELLASRKLEPFHRLASFLIHDLKNLATQQSMVLANARNFGNQPECIQDAFATFGMTTDKMISLIANLSIQKGHIAASQQPLNVLEILTLSFGNLKIFHRKGVKLITEFPSQRNAPIVCADPSLLEKAFTNILLNAMQSLPNGEGTLQVAVSNPNGKVIISITDTGCGFDPEILKDPFRPFQTAKTGGIGIGLCHTRSIVEVHGGQIRIESHPNTGTKVEIELPAYQCCTKEERSNSESTDSSVQ